MKIINRLAIFTVFLAVLSGCEKVWDTSGYDPIPERPSGSTDDSGDGGNETPEPPGPSVTPPSPTPSISPAYQITGGAITQTVLNNYLSRAITESEYLCENYTSSETFFGNSDDKRMLLNIGAKFIGRAIYYWGKEARFGNELWFDVAKRKVDEYHKQDPEAIFQAAVFEIVTTDVNQVWVPDWVFTAFGKTPETRKFSFDRIKSSNGNGYWGANTCVPNIGSEETQMWFYYQIVRYMEAGCEAVHLGQINLISGMSTGGSAGYKILIDKVRAAARTKARRGVVLLDGHSVGGGGLVIDGRQYLDFVSFPLRLREKTAEQATLGAAFDINGSRYHDNIIGRTSLPYLLEFDNFGVNSNPGHATSDHFVWGYDEITWFAKLSFTDGCVFLDYAVNYLKQHDPTKGHIQMPGLRVVILPKNPFRCNATAFFPNGYNYEGKIKEIWSR